MLKILLIDDEVRATDALTIMIDKLLETPHRITVCNDARNASSMIHKISPSLIFLDIHMPHFSGFEILKSIPHRKFGIIFTTAYDEYAINAIRFSAFDYLLKPIDAEELSTALSRFIQESAISFPQELFGNVIHNMQSDQFRLALPTREGVHYLMPNELCRCEALGNYTRFFATDNRQFLISRTLAEYDEILSPYGFIRTHKSHLVNRNFISYIDHEGFLILKDSSRIEVSRRRKEFVMKCLAS